MPAHGLVGLACPPTGVTDQKSIHQAKAIDRGDDSSRSRDQIFTEIIGGSEFFRKGGSGGKGSMGPAQMPRKFEGCEGGGTRDADYHSCSRVNADPKSC